MLEISFWMVVFIISASFFCKYIDIILGMGYGTILSPTLLLFGFSPIQIIPAILLSELITGLLAGFFHYRLGNVNFSFKPAAVSEFTRQIKISGRIKDFTVNMPLHFKLVFILSLCGIIGVVTGVFAVVYILPVYVKLYIGLLVFFMGLVIILSFNKKLSFSWKRTAVLGFIASFNKTTTGGGYGPIVTCGQILSGVKGRSAVTITSLAKGLTCLAGVLAYIFISKNVFNRHIVFYIITGAVFSVPFAVTRVKKIRSETLKFFIAAFSILLGIVIIMKTLYSF